jgi:hypothetical protein
MPGVIEAPAAFNALGWHSWAARKIMQAIGV